MTTATLSRSNTTIKPVSFDDMARLNTPELLKQLGETGVLLFKEGAQNVDEFCDFVKQHSSRLSMDPARVIEGGVAQLVDAGTDAVGLHCENGNSPFWPDLTWFYCKEAPSKGSETTVCDGISVFNRLSADTQQFFLNNDIRYSRNVQADKWKRLVCHYTPGLARLEDARLEHLLALTKNDPHTEIIYHPENESIDYHFTVSAIQVSDVSGLPAFANSVLGPSYNYEKPKITIATTGEPIPPAYMEEIIRVTEEETIPIRWNDNDFVMIDNRRVMHGRNAIVDSRRKIFNALSYL